MTQLKEQYQKTVVPKFMSEFNYKNALAVPRVSKVVISSGVGRAAQDPKLLESVTTTLAHITGQRPKVTVARKAIASFKIRKGASVGLMVTLRGKRMEDFLSRLINIVLPRIRDFRGLSRQGFDGRGNYNLGIREQIVFPEITPDKIQGLHGLQLTIHTTAKNDDEGYALLSNLGFPFKKDEASLRKE